MAWSLGGGRNVKFCLRFVYIIIYLQSYGKENYVTSGAQCGREDYICDREHL